MSVKVKNGKVLINEQEVAIPTRSNKIITG